ncbi:hypothetical protein RJT34_30462 [Clitoria ternatea]|uniref:Uncharacterized protein n=1 Tax=Clitoria ternatea TaxID=43366 RepID=A0AAN9ET49_CLITE
MDDLLMKAEKANAIRTHTNMFAAISKTLRILEIAIILILLFWILTRLPFALALTAQLLRRLAAFAASPLVVFAVSNAIIAALLAQSGRFAAQTSAEGLYRDLLNNRCAVADRPSPTMEPALSPPEAEFQDKQVIAETVQDRACLDGGARSEVSVSKYRRSQSEKWKGEGGKLPRRRQLRRSETEKQREKSPGILYPQDKLSSEEFQEAIEAFIAKQMRFLREESSAIVVQNPS